MPLRTDSYYRQLVNDHLKQAGIDEPPISLEEVAGRLGVPIVPVPFPMWFTGAIVNEPTGNVIMVNASSPAEKRRNALGHMLAHILLDADSPGEAYPRGAEREHRIADMMASEFVTPTYLVHEQARKWFNDYRYLAGLFGVTEAEMLDRMHTMGLIRTRGMIWDY
jgi:Zn-dependent peptidase ImmA (M78 family)